MAKRYGKLPTELMELTTFDFSFNVKIMTRALNHEQMIHKKMIAEQKAKSRSRRTR